jgi:hypothetical protein
MRETVPRSSPDSTRMRAVGCVTALSSTWELLRRVPPQAEHLVVTREEFHRAVLAFLDQFISRGAAPDLIEVRDSLVRDPTAIEKLLSHFPAGEVSQRRAYDAMVEYLGAEWRARGEYVGPASGPPGLFDLSWWCEWGRNLAGDDMTADPAMWFDWVAVAPD